MCRNVSAGAFLLAMSFGCRGQLAAPPGELNASASPAAPDRQTERLSMVRLIAAPEEFEGRLVQVVGFLHFEFEEQAVYLHREDSDMLNSSNGLWLDGSGEYADLNDSYVIVQGTFTSTKHGHLGLWPGAIQNITRLERARSRADYEKIIRSSKP